MGVRAGCLAVAGGLWIGILAAAVPAAAADYRVGDIFKDCDVCPLVAVLPAGSFVMGSPVDEPGRFADEGPQREVTFSRPFAVGVREVTFQEWDGCVDDGGCRGYRPNSNGWPRGPHLSVREVGWTDAQAYLKWLSQKTGHTYRLPTEAEWEYAARAGTTTAWNYGTDLKDFRYDQGPAGEPVTAPNAWGLINFHTMIMEWVEDRYHDSYEGAPSDGHVAWVDGTSPNRVTRDGSFNRKETPPRSALRGMRGEQGRDEEVGFRVVREL